MLRHLLKLTWHRKRANALVGLEIFISFLVLFLVSGLSVSTVRNMAAPLGFSYDNVLQASVDRRGMNPELATPQEAETTRQLLRAVQSMPEVEHVATTLIVPYTMSEARDGVTLNGRTLMFGFTEVSEGYKDTMRLSIARGRWFSREDDGAGYRPVVMTPDLARTIFGDADPIGRDLPAEGSMSSGGRPSRVVGVLEAYRGNGEFAVLGPFLLGRAELEGPAGRVPANLVVRVRPGTPRAFEETLVKTLEGVARNWSFTVEPMSQLREASKRRTFLPLATVGLVSGFLMLMVGLGLTGVLWQNVTKRTKEIGLRRAAGATGRQISAQILAEIWIVTTLALALGAAVVLQLPLLDLVEWVSPGTFATGFGVSVLVLYGLTALCALYPGWLATRVLPSEALRYE